MVLLMLGEVVEKIGGFDEKYFLYYEDVDLCKRLRLSGYKMELGAWSGKLSTLDARLSTLFL
jgi:hypothetical protein